MKVSQSKSPSLLRPIQVATLGFVLAGQLTAQTFTTLHSFTAVHWRTGYDWTNSDGGNPRGGLILSNNTLYGTAPYYGSSSAGTVFSMNTDGTGFTTLYTFMKPAGNYTPYTNSDGANPFSGLVLSDNTLYGTASEGGILGGGTVFSVKTDGMGFTNLYSFNRGPGGGPQRAGLILSGNTLYGTTEYGGNWGYGSVFALNTDGTGFTNLYSFTAPKGYIPTNADGAYPIAALTISSNTLYGTAAEGGAWGWGTVFKVNTDGTGFTNLHSISAIDQRTRTNSDGTITAGPLILCGHTLYGAAELGGSFSNGTVFAVNTDGTGFTNLHNFAALLQSTNSDGTSPKGGLILSGNTLFGTASGGGTFGNGTIFSISFPPQLTVIPSGTNVILTWPTNSGGFSYDGYILQSTTNLVSPVWTTNSPAPVVVNGQNTVTNLISGKQQFFRLSE